MKKNVKMNKYEELLNAVRTNYGTHSEYYKTVKELVDKARPKKSTRRDMLYCNCNNGECEEDYIYYCPVCNIGDVEDMNYCFECGNKLEGNKE